MKRFSLLLPLLLVISGSASAATMAWSFVGNPGNAADTNGYGAVAYPYAIGTYEVTNAQYAEFLNAVSDSDPRGLYNPNMGGGWGGITRSGSDGGYSYGAIAGRENMPVNYVSFYDALRFANWLHNGQPTGGQDASTTEDGAYTITAAGVFDNTITRNAGAIVFLPTADEWYKAAYGNAVGTSYFAFPGGTNATMLCSSPTSTPNRANCGNVINPQIGDVAPVGSYVNSASAYGTFDQGGNVSEWNERIVQSTLRGTSGTGFNVISGLSSASANGSAQPVGGEVGLRGFRVASTIPEPGTGLLLIAGLLGLARRRAPCSGSSRGRA